MIGTGCNVIAAGDGGSFVFVIIGVWIVIGILNALARKAMKQAPPTAAGTPVGEEAKSVEVEEGDTLQDLLETLRKQAAPPPPPLERRLEPEPVQVKITTRGAYHSGKPPKPPSTINRKSAPMRPVRHPVAGTIRRRSILRNLHETGTWPNAVLMREIIGPPLALKPAQGGDRSH